MKLQTYLYITISLVVLAACDLEVIPDVINRGSPNPEATFEIINNNCRTPCDPGFKNNSTNASSFEWNFGDGTTSELRNPPKTYQKEGTYNVSLTAKNEVNASDDTTIQVTILESNLPVADFSYAPPTNLCPAPCELQFTNKSKKATSYLWDFGDPESGEDNRSTLENPIHIFKNAGQYSVTLNAINEVGQDTHSMNIPIRNWTCGDTLTDSRDKNEYPTLSLVFPSQNTTSCWLGSNLNFNSAFSECLNDAQEICNVYGRLYDFQFMANACPSGWHIATEEEWDILFQNSGLIPKDVIESTIYEGDPSPLLEGGTSGLKVLLGGYIYDGNSLELENSTAFWTAEQKAVQIGKKNVSISKDLSLNSLLDAYIRCVKDE